MTVYQEARVEDVLEEIKPLLLKHWEELANHKEDRVLNPDLDLYIALNKTGAFKLFTVRDGGKLVGYTCYMVYPNPHYKQWLYAVCDVYYVDPEARKQGIGKDLFSFSERALKEYGIKSITSHVKVTHPHDELFLSLDYNLVERHYEKVL